MPGTWDERYPDGTFVDVKTTRAPARQIVRQTLKVEHWEEPGHGNKQSMVLAFLNAMVERGLVRADRTKYPRVTGPMRISGWSAYEGDYSHDLWLAEGEVVAATEGAAP